MNRKNMCIISVGFTAAHPKDSATFWARLPTVEQI